jgi:hypothetical protein
MHEIRPGSEIAGIRVVEEPLRLFGQDTMVGLSAALLGPNWILHSGTQSPIEIV